MLKPPTKVCRRCGQSAPQDRRVCTHCARGTRNEYMRRYRAKRVLLPCGRCGAVVERSRGYGRVPVCGACWRIGKRWYPGTTCTAPVPGGCHHLRARHKSMCHGHIARRKRGQPLDTPIGSSPGPVPKAGRCMVCGCRGDCLGGCLMVLPSLCSACQPAGAKS